VTLNVGHYKTLTLHIALAYQSVDQIFDRTLFDHVKKWSKVHSVLCLEFVTY